MTCCGVSAGEGSFISRRRVRQALNLLIKVSVVAPPQLDVRRVAVRVALAFDGPLFRPRTEPYRGRTAVEPESPGRRTESADEVAIWTSRATREQSFSPTRSTPVENFQTSYAGSI